jgi:DNA-binding MarR family transcriptional regulator
LVSAERAYKDSSRRKRRVQEFNKSFELLGSGLQVLKKLGADCTASEVAQDLGCCKSNVTYWKDKLVDMGALRLRTVDVVKLYSLTPYGSKLLTGSEGVFHGTVYVLEDHPVKFEIIESEKSHIDWQKLGQPRNWEKFDFKVGNVRVVKTSRSIIIHPGKLKGFDVDELEVTAGQTVGRVKAFLENRFGMVLSEEGIPLHKPIWQVFSPEAEEWAKAGTVNVNGVGQLDRSPPDRIAHREYSQKQLAVDAVMAPVILANLEQKVDIIAENVGRLISSVDRLSDVLGKLVQPQPDLRERIESEVPSYVT